MIKRCQFLAEYLERVDGTHPKQGTDKHVKMAMDAFLFFRGSSQLYYADIANGTLSLPQAFNHVPHTAIMGDCHVSNFGFFTEEGSHGDNVIFAANDFDDACIGPAVWDISRFIISLKLAANFGESISNGTVSIEDKYLKKSVVNQQQVLNAITCFLSAYSNTCQRSVEDSSTCRDAIEHIADDHILYKPYVKALNRSAGGSEFEVKSSLAKAIDWHGNKVKFRQQTNKFSQISQQLYQEIEHTFAPYVDDQILDIVVRHGAGTGSLNLTRYYLLVGPKHMADQTDLMLCHIVEVKQQRPAAPLYHFNNISANNRLNPAHLTVYCQRRMQRSPDLVLDSVIWNNQYWLVRSRHHAKVGIKPENIVLGKKACKKQGLAQYAATCGVALALSHCRSDRRSTLFEHKMSQALVTNTPQVIDACMDYVKQVELDRLSLVGLMNA